MRVGYLGLQMCNGFSDRMQEGPMQRLVFTIDCWIEKNTGLISEITVSPKFYHALTKEVGYPVLFVETLVGGTEIVVKPMQDTEIEVR
jgi:hypothetical protein